MRTGRRRRPTGRSPCLGERPGSTTQRTYPHPLESHDAMVVPFEVLDQRALPPHKLLRALAPAMGRKCTLKMTRSKLDKTAVILSEYLSTNRSFTASAFPGGSGFSKPTPLPWEYAVKGRRLFFAIVQHRVGRPTAESLGLRAKPALLTFALGKERPGRRGMASCPWRITGGMPVPRKNSCQRWLFGPSASLSAVPLSEQ